MNLSLQEEWSPELLSELQRAVPVLESGSFDLEDDEVAGSFASGTSHGRFNWSQNALGDWPQNSRDDSGARWGGWAQDAGQSLLARSSRSGAPLLPGPLPDDLLSDNAMALPMSTLTSGKRKTYPNKSTFQAHVCCVMDPLQVPRVMESLQSSPHFKSVRSWPYAYRIISPFDGQTHEGSDDDNDVGAGEKMVGLLKRMGLENLLLVISRWDVGNSNRLGAELFKCVNEQCKDLLKELQQAVRASFPPEEFMMGRPDDSYSSGTPALQDGTAGEGSGTCSVLDSEAQCLISCGSVQSEEPMSAAGSRHVDLRAIGATPPPELLYASRGVCAQSTRRRGGPPPSPPMRDVPDPADHGYPGLTVRSCTVASRAAAQMLQSGCSSSEVSAAASGARGESHNSGLSLGSQAGQDQGAAFITETEAGSDDLGRLSNEDLLRTCAQLRAERESLESELEGLGKYDKVISGLKMPLFFETKKESKAKGKRQRPRLS